MCVRVSHSCVYSVEISRREVLHTWHWAACSRTTRTLRCVTLACGPSPWCVELRTRPSVRLRESMMADSRGWMVLMVGGRRKKALESGRWSLRLVTGWRLRCVAPTLVRNSNGRLGDSSCELHASSLWFFFATVSIFTVGSRALATWLPTYL